MPRGAPLQLAAPATARAQAHWRKQFLRGGGRGTAAASQAIAACRKPSRERGTARPGRCSARVAGPARPKMGAAAAAAERQPARGRASPTRPQMRERGRLPRRARPQEAATSTKSEENAERARPHDDVRRAHGARAPAARTRSGRRRRGTRGARPRGA
eukprot:12242845-Alexandrium_andersonii.AAC.1